MADAYEVSPARQRVAESLKILGSATAAQLAIRLDITQVAVRQHLQGLEEMAFARSRPLPGEGRGRPSRLWSLTPRAMGLFPDGHGELTVGLIEAIRGVVGDEALDAIVEARGEAQKQSYAALMPEPAVGVRARVEALAEQRSREGYMADVRCEEDGSFLLVEHHCPICEAASACVGLCRVELDVFRHALGPGADVMRESHLLSGDDRCIYRIRRLAREGSGEPAPPLR